MNCGEQRHLFAPRPGVSREALLVVTFAANVTAPGCITILVVELAQSRWLDVASGLCGACFFEWPSGWSSLEAGSSTTGLLMRVLAVLREASDCIYAIINGEGCVRIRLCDFIDGSVVVGEAGAAFFVEVGISDFGCLLEIEELNALL